MNMIGREDVADESESVAATNLIENLDRQVPGARGGEQRPTLITAKCDEMQIAWADEAFQSFRHDSEEGPTLCEKRKG
jgi:hypothetical protein